MFLIFLGIWILFNGRFTWEIFLWGVGVSGLLYAFCKKFLWDKKEKETNFFALIIPFLSYLGLLIKEIAVANWATIRIVYSKKQIKPKLVTFRCPLDNNVTRTILCDSITLTPGTITVEVEGDLITVHCLDESLAEGIENTSFQQFLINYNHNKKEETV